MDNSPTFQPASSASQYFYKHRGFGFLIVGFLLLKLAITAFFPNNHYIQASDLTPANILNAVNRERSLRNLVILNTNDKLGVAAQSKASDMIARKYFAHVDPDGHYIWDKIVAAGYTPYAQLGENLAIEFYDTDSLMNAWMNSPTHRANILQEGFRDQGMGLSFGDVGQGQYYSAIANTFGTLAAAKNPTVTTPTTPTKTTPPAATQTPSKTTSKPSTPAPTTNSPAPTTTTPNTTPATQPITLRGDGLPAQQEQSSFSFPTKDQPITTSTSEAASLQLSPAQSASAVVGDKDATTLTNYQANRYLILIAGVVLLLLMGTDLKKAMSAKLGSLDKKTNNIALLVIAIIVIAFMYWL